jgi:hypothetical protein
VPDLVVKKCMKFIIKPLTDICNISLESDVFTDELKTAKSLCITNGIKKISKIIDPIPPVSLFKNFRKDNEY